MFIGLISGRRHTRTAWCDSFPGNKHQAQILQLARASRTAGHASMHTLTALSCSLLLSRDERNWATALSGSHCADYWPSQLRLRNRISPRQPPVEGTQPCVTDADNAVVQFIECTPRGSMTDRIVNARNWIRIRIYKSNFEFSNFF